ncbi:MULTISPECIES: type VI secretion system accessory protein TagJ [unclassified Pantoea]|jgi:Protein of avirulence locus involved in temperature-dependent protein secretion|uniref:type VI secretion system accessory protein TagJ n=1 Tax=unclassified Pantoea TaxID=2630326 RepID=UPI000BDB4112|nr:MULTISPECIES: type VI secretion system accessory protein TagJ [unclassified Pantoea]MDI6958844.1 type VI secretion system accessory protein TagJ [Pantoea sp. Pa-EAmG]MDI9279913.1 type VI secretion system accessory protein TagJ [Pantoea sp. EABMAA-21]SNY55295.1 type VI secretion system protein ImpE [Pantoea sp. GL120224-02]
MESLQQRLADASLAENLARTTAQIQANPADANLRATFVQLLCMAGNWTRAQTQLQSWLALTPQAQPTITLLQQAIAGELQRAAVLRGESQPQLPGSAWAWSETLLAALQAEVKGDEARGADLRQQALEQADANPGTLEQQDQSVAFPWLMDGDSRFGPVCEAIVNGRYYWVPFAAIREMQFQAPASVTDLVWRHTLIQLVDGSEQVCQIPVRYPLPAQAEESWLRASVTEWQPLGNVDSQFIGLGQKVWLSDSAEFSLMTLQRITFNDIGPAYES